MWQPVSTYLQYALPTSAQCITKDHTAIWNTINPSCCDTARFSFLTPTSPQLLFITTAAYCLVSLHVCQNTKNIVSKIQIPIQYSHSYRTPHIPTQNDQLPTYSSTFKFLNASTKCCDNIIQLSNKIMNIELWQNEIWDADLDLFLKWFIEGGLV